MPFVKVAISQQKMLVERSSSFHDCGFDSFFFLPFQRKMLAVYFHHDSSVLTNVFCTQALCADSVCSFLNENFISFGWDLTFSSNKTRAVDMITKHFGSVAASTLKNMDIERLPLLVLIYKLRGSTEIFHVSTYYNVDDVVLSATAVPRL